MTVMAERIRLAWDFASDYSTGMSATSEAGNMVVENVLNQQPSSRWRSTTTAAQVIQGTFTELTLVKFLLLYAHNLTIGATVKLELSNDTFATVDGTFEWEYSEGVAGFGEDMFGIMPFGGVTTSNGRFPFFLAFLDDTINQETGLVEANGMAVTDWRVTITDTLNSDGYVELGRVALDTYWSPEECNAIYGYNWKRIRAKAGEGHETRNGGWRSLKRPTYRQFSFSFDLLSEADEAYLDDLFFDAGDSRNVLVVMYPKAATGLYRRHLALGFLVDDDGITRNDALYRGSSLTIREAL
jgi:hypothetical protein